MTEHSPPSPAIVGEEKENIDNVAIAIHPSSPVKSTSAPSTFKTRPKPTTTSANVGNTRVARANKSISMSPTADLDKDRFLSPYSTVQAHSTSNTSSHSGEEREDSTNSAEREAADIFLPSPKVSPRERPANPYNIAPHKFAPHVWKPKHCKICYRTLDEHDASEIANSARANESPWHNLSSREHDLLDGATVNSNEPRSTLNANSKASIATGSDGSAKPGLTAGGFAAGGTNLTQSRMSLNLDALRLNSMRHWISNHPNFYNSLASANHQLPFVEKFQLESVVRNYKDDITLVAHISLKPNFVKLEDLSQSEKIFSSVDFQMKEKLYDDLLVRLQAKDKLLRKKEIELINRENRLNQKAAALSKETPAQSLSGTHSNGSDGLLDPNYNASQQGQPTQQSPSPTESPNKQESQQKQIASQLEILESELALLEQIKSQTFEVKGNAVEIAVEEIAVQTQLLDFNQELEGMQALALKTKKLEIARTSPLIKKCKGFAVWEARERLELTQDTLLAFEFPEHDVFYYRDNFLINPTAYQLLEDCVQNYATEMQYFLDNVHASFFHDHINLVSDDPIVFIASIRKVPDSQGNITGIVRTKLGDRPFFLADGEWKREVASTSELVAAFRRHFTCFGRSKLMAIETMYFPDRNGEDSKGPRQHRSNSLQSNYKTTKERISTGLAPIVGSRKEEKARAREEKEREKAATAQAASNGSNNNGGNSGGGALSSSGGVTPTASSGTLQPAPSPTKLIPKYLPIELLNLDRKLKVQNYKFGVLYSPGNCGIEEILSITPERVNPNFFKFMNFIGMRVKMKGWKGFSGDLDTKGDSDSYYCDYESASIMYHCAPLLSVDDRARHLGNDLLLIVWVDEGEWDASIYESQVNHASIVIRPIVDSDGVMRVRIGFIARKGIPETHPHFSSEAFDLDENFRRWFLTKCINMERACWRCPTTIRSQQKPLRELYWATREGLLKYLVQQHMTSEHGKEYSGT